MLASTTPAFGGEPADDGAAGAASAAVTQTELASPLAPSVEPPPFVHDPYAGRGSRNAGIGLLFMGSAVVAVGAGILVEAQAGEEAGVSDWETAPGKWAGGWLVASGGLMFLVGLPLLVSGQLEMAANEEELAGFQPRVVMGPGSVEVGWSF